MINCQYFTEINIKFKIDFANHRIEDEVCIAGNILMGIKKPYECPAFKIICTPEHPLGAPMVSSEGACAAYFHYQLESTKQND